MLCQECHIEVWHVTSNDAGLPGVSAHEPIVRRPGNPKVRRADGRLHGHRMAELSHDRTH
eukprot:1161889-Pelagomonas_calceolata.AAC.1